MSADGGPPPPRPANGNLWDVDVDTDGLQYLLWVQRTFSNYVTEHMRFVQSDPLGGKDANTQAQLGRELVFLGEAMQEHSRLRADLMKGFGGPILQHLASLKRGERVDAHEIASQLGTFALGVDIVLQDLARSGAVDAVRPRVATLGRFTTYAITPQGRVLLERPALASTPVDGALGGSDASDK